MGIHCQNWTFLCISIWAILRARVDSSVGRSILRGMELSVVAGFLLDGSGPRNAAQRILTWLQHRTEARSVAIWRAEGVEFSLEISVAADEQTIEGARALWTRSRASLAEGGPATADSAILLPIHPAGSYLYLDGVDPRRLDLEVAADGGGVAVMALRRLRSSAGRAGTVATGDVREELLSALRLHEWNVARVARVKGVTRKTIYDWLQKYNIPRERVRKT